MQHCPPVFSFRYFTSHDSINPVEIMPSNKNCNLVGQKNPPGRMPPSLAGLATQKLVRRAAVAPPGPSLAGLRGCLSITRPPLDVLFSNHCFRQRPPGQHVRVHRSCQGYVVFRLANRRTVSAFSDRESTVATSAGQGGNVSSLQARVRR